MQGSSTFTKDAIHYYCVIEFINWTLYNSLFSVSIPSCSCIGLSGQGFGAASWPLRAEPARAAPRGLAATRAWAVSEAACALGEQTEGRAKRCSTAAGKEAALRARGQCRRRAGGALGARLHPRGQRRSGPSPDRHVRPRRSPRCSSRRRPEGVQPRGNWPLGELPPVRTREEQCASGGLHRAGWGGRKGRVGGKLPV